MSARHPLSCAREPLCGECVRGPQQSPLMAAAAALVPPRVPKSCVASHAPPAGARSAVACAENSDTDHSNFTTQGLPPTTRPKTSKTLNLPITAARVPPRDLTSLRCTSIDRTTCLQTHSSGARRQSDRRLRVRQRRLLVRVKRPQRTVCARPPHEQDVRLWPVDRVVHPAARLLHAKTPPLCQHQRWGT